MANPFVHVELNASDLDKAKTFYGRLFDWNLDDVPMATGPYTMIGVGDEGTGGGMLTHPMPGAQSAWIPYVAVDDVADATLRAKSLGATIVRDVTEIPDYGSFSIVQDPTGGVLGLWMSAQR
jgi:predicted enzyme related to lactoylglutathione lyase